MPIEFSISADCNCVFTRAWGVLTPAEVGEHMERLQADPGYSPDMPRLVDMRRLDDVFSMAALRKSVQDIRAFNQAHHPRIAVIVKSDLVFGMVRVIESLTNDEAGSYRAFRSLQEGVEWLGVDGPAIRDLLAACDGDPADDAQRGA